MEQQQNKLSSYLVNGPIDDFLHRRHDPKAVLTVPCAIPDTYVTCT